MTAANASLIYSLAAVAFCWVLLWLLWRKRVFLQV
jgi:predicted acyltransferase